MAGIHQTLREARSLYAEALKLQEAVLASHRELKGYVAQAETWHKSAESLLAQVETSRVRLKYLGQGFLALVFMIGTLAGAAGGFLALLAFRLAGGGWDRQETARQSRDRRGPERGGPERDFGPSR